MERDVLCKSTNYKKAGVAVLISDNINIKARGIIRDKEVNFIMKSGSVHQEDKTIIILNMCKNRVSEYTKQKLMEKNIKLQP